MKDFKNKLVIIGNGFDLAHGLKTSYQDFLNWYLNDVWEKAKINGIFSDDLLNIKIRSTHIHLYINEKFNIELFINRGGQEVFYTPGDSSKILKIEYNSVLLEKLLNVVRDYRWVDIEMEYYNLLVNSFLDGRIINGDLENVKRLNSDFNFIKDKLEEYLKTLDDFSTIEEVQKLFKDSFGSSHWESNYREIHYLNFNYTNTVEKYIPKDYCKYELNYIHGKLNDNDNPLIFGYGDEVDSNYEKIENLNNNLFLNNFKSFGYF